MKQYASCSIAPDSRRSDSNGRLLEPRVSTARESWDNAITGTFNSLAKAFKFREMVEISSLFPPLCHSLLLSLTANNQQ
jgi:hypothetical protein